MNFILFIFLSGLFYSGISNLKPNMEAEYYEEEENMSNNIRHGEKRNININPPVQEGQMNTDTTSVNEKTGNQYRHTNQYEFTTQNPNDNQSEITVKATTDLTFALKNYKIITTTENPTKEENEPIEFTHKNKQKPTQNVPEFWTMLVKAINGTTVGMDDKDQLFRPIPSSDVNTSSKIEKEDSQSDLQDLRLTLILGITLMTLIIFVTLLAFCIATLFKLKNLSSKRSKSQYSINPELASLSYFHPSKGVSDTSFSKSAESSTYWDTSSSDLQKSTSRKSKSQNTTDLTSTSSEDSGVNDQSGFLVDEEPNEEINIDK